MPARTGPPSPILKHFAYGHLPDHLLRISKPIGSLASMLDTDLPDCAEKSAGLRKLLEAKDCFVRAALEADEPMADGATTTPFGTKPGSTAGPKGV